MSDPWGRLGNVIGTRREFLVVLAVAALGLVLATLVTLTPWHPHPLTSVIEVQAP
jgi:hypothetical protein